MTTRNLYDTRAEQLLSEALDLLNDTPNFTLRHDRTRSSYALASRIEAHRREPAPAPQFGALDEACDRLRAGDEVSQLRVLWEALHLFREHLAPEGEEAHDHRWSELTSAMHWLGEELDVSIEELDA